MNDTVNAELARARARLTASARKRELAWKQFREPVLAYARLVAQRYSLRGVKIKGNNHVERVGLNLANCFEKLLPYEDVAVNKRGQKCHYTSGEILQRFETALLAVGVDIRARSSPIVSIRTVRRHLVVFRLTGCGPEFESHEARKTRRIRQRQEADWSRLVKAEAEEYRREKLRAAFAELFRPWPKLLPILCDSTVKV